MDTINDDALSVLLNAAWPGNVRELENAIERLVVLGCEVIVTTNDLSFLKAQEPGDSWSGLGSSSLTLKQMNHRCLDWVLARTDGDKGRAAGILNISLSTLYIVGNDQEVDAERPAAQIGLWLRGGARRQFVFKWGLRPTNNHSALVLAWLCVESCHLK